MRIAVPKETLETQVQLVRLDKLEPLGLKVQQETQVLLGRKVIKVQVVQLEILEPLARLVKLVVQVKLVTLELLV